MKKIAIMVMMLLLIGTVITGVIMAAGSGEDIGDPCKEDLSSCESWCEDAVVDGEIKTAANLLTNPSFEIISIISSTAPEE
ncbi:hypothetical protein HQ529_06215 [Candidatus Woesearchaeota archaeon]|nr:hypothetical protein [Candidatus Woesearchaeota archaeon]